MLNRVPNRVLNRVLNRVPNRVPNRVLNRVLNRVPNRVLNGVRLKKIKKLKYFFEKNGSQNNIKCHHQDFTILEVATTIMCRVST